MKLKKLLTCVISTSVSSRLDLLRIKPATQISVLMQRSVVSLVHAHLVLAFADTDWLSSVAQVHEGQTRQFGGLLELL